MDNFEDFITKLKDHFTSISQGSKTTIDSDYDGSDLLKIIKESKKDPLPPVVAGHELHQSMVRAKKIQSKTHKSFFEDSRKELNGKLERYSRISQSVRDLQL